jgi:SAM-dependent methyltransferase
VSEYGPETYGERIADVYDDWYRYLGAGEPEVPLLAELASGGRVLELGVGTGRVALPLAARGIEVHGIDASPAMVERLRAKPGGDAIAVTIGDMADVDVDGAFRLVFVVFNTFFMLDTQAAQVRCMRNVASRLEPGGRFLVHAFVPDVSRFRDDQQLSVRSVDGDMVRLDASVYDPQLQRVDSTQMRITESGIRLVHARLRFAYPSELDLMAQLAGLELESRWGSFGREPFTAGSAFHVSVYRRPP